MKIIIIGAGQVGSTLTEKLVTEKNDLTVIDTDRSLLGILNDKYDLRTSLPARSLIRFSMSRTR